MAAFNYISVLRENCSPVENCGPETCGFVTCADLESCGPAGESLSDADFECEIAGAANDPVDCVTVDDGCAAFNDTFLSSAPQTGGGCQCMGANITTDGTCVGGVIPAVGGWSILEPGCNHATGGQTWYTDDEDVWRIQVWLGTGSGNNGEWYELSDQDAIAALAILCAGGEVDIPHVATGPSTCFSSVPTVTLRSIFP